MCTRSASERIEVRASLMSSLRISRSGPSRGLTERPTPDGLDVCLEDTWSVMNSPKSRLSPILPKFGTRVSTGRRLSVTTFIGHRQAHAGAQTTGGRRLDHGYEHLPPTDRAHRSTFRTRADARADTGAVPR